MGRGGSRQGAGRKIIGGGSTQRKTYSFSLLPELIETLDQVAAGARMSRSQALELVLRQLDLDSIFPDDRDQPKFG